MVAERVAVLELAFEEVRDRLEAAVWMPRRAGAGTRRELDRAGVVEEQERIDVRQRPRRERPADDEAIALDRSLGGDESGDGGWGCCGWHGELLCCCHNS